MKNKLYLLILMGLLASNQVVLAQFNPLPFPMLIGKKLFQSNNDFVFRKGIANLTDGQSIDGEFRYDYKNGEGFMCKMASGKSKFLYFKKIEKLWVLGPKGDTTKFERLPNKVLARYINPHFFDENYAPFDTDYEITVPIYVLDQEPLYPTTDVKKGFWGGLPNLIFVNTQTQKESKCSDYNIDKNLKIFLENQSKQLNIK